MSDTFYNSSGITPASIGAVDVDQIGTAGGVAELDGSGKVLTAQLPSYVDDVVEYANYASLPITGESGLIYVTIDNGKCFRWGGSTYAEISASLTLGETSCTAYRGDYGKVAYEHVGGTSNPHSVTAAQVGTLTESAIKTLVNGSITIDTSASYDVLATDRNKLIHYGYSASGVGAINLPSIAGLSIPAGEKWRVTLKDADINAGTNKVVVNANGADTVEDPATASKQASFDINSDGECRTLYAINGDTNWYQE